MNKEEILRLHLDITLNYITQNNEVVGCGFFNNEIYIYLSKRNILLENEIKNKYPDRNFVFQQVS